MTQVNLLPPEVRTARRAAAANGRIRRASLIGLLLLGGLYGIRSVEVVLLRGELADVRAEAASTQERIDALAEIATAEQVVRAGSALESQLWRGEVSWSTLLLEISEAVPTGFTLTTLNAQAAIADGPTIGTVAFSAAAGTTAQPRLWLQRIAAQEGWANGWLGSVTEDPAGGATVTGSFDLTPNAVTIRGGGPA